MDRWQKRKEALKWEASEAMDVRDILMKRLIKAERKNKIEIAARLREDLKRLNKKKEQINQQIDKQANKIRRKHR